MAYTQNDIDTLKAAIATGALEVEFGAGPDKRRVKYRSLADMRATLADMMADVSPARPPSNTTFAEHGRD